MDKISTNKEIGNFISEVNDEKFIKLIIATRVKYYREKKGWSGRELARRMEIDDKMVRRFEDPDYECTPTLTSLIKLANILDVRLIDLLS